MVTVPPASRRGWARPDPLITGFLADREPWVRRHLARQDATRTRLGDRAPWTRAAWSRTGASRTASGWSPRRRHPRSRVSRVGGDDGDELLVERTARDSGPTAVILEAWFRERARTDLERALVRHGPPLA